MSTFTIPDMTCGHCKATVEKAIHELDTAAVITVDLESHRVDVVSQNTTSGAIVAALKSAGYEAQPATT